MFKNFRGVNKLHISNLNDIPNITGNENELESYILAGKIHKNIRFCIQENLKIGTSIYDLSQLINNKIRKYTKNIGVNSGIAFPPILSVSDCIAHYSPTKKTDIKLKYDDNVKIDFGVHVNGYIVDSAFSAYFNKKHDLIHKACYEALLEGIKYMKIDALVRDCSDVIQEIIDSYDFEVIKGVNGHSIERYNVHGNINILNYGKKYSYTNERFKKGAFAIEPFISYKSSNFFEDKYANNYKVNNKNSELYKYFNNLIFTDSHLEYYNINNIFNKEKKDLYYYPALYIDKEDIGVQYEHTVYITDTNTINITKGYDY